MYHSKNKPASPARNNESKISRRRVIKTLSVGLSLTALPSFMATAKHEVSTDALEHDERIIPVEERELIEMQKFIEDCIAANKESNAQEAVKEVLARGVSESTDMLKAIGEPTEAGMKVFYRSPTLTIFAASWTPQMNLMPHNHLMWANIGIYTGREDNIFWERNTNGLEAKGVKCLFTGDVASLNSNAIHSVTNPLQRFTGGLHIYGGDFFATERSQWDPESLHEVPSNGEVIRNIFKKANEQMLRMKNE